MRISKKDEEKTRRIIQRLGEQIYKEFLKLPVRYGELENVGKHEVLCIYSIVVTKKAKDQITTNVFAFGVLPFLAPITAQTIQVFHRLSTPIQRLNLTKILQGESNEYVA